MGIAKITLLVRGSNIQQPTVLNVVSVMREQMTVFKARWAVMNVILPLAMTMVSGVRAPVQLAHAITAHKHANERSDHL